MRVSRRLLCLLGVGLAASFAVAVDSVDAQPYRYYSERGRRVPLRSARPTERAEKAKEKSVQPQPVHLIVISIPKQRISVFGASGFRTQNVVSTGM